MNSLLLRGTAALVTAATFVGATGYVVVHPKNPLAPLQPPVSDLAVRPSASRSPTPAPSASGASRATARPTTTPRPVPKITLQPAVRATALPGITYTHTS